MATKTAEKTADKSADKSALPQIDDAEEMPKPKRGRQSSIDLAPFIDKLQDLNAHSIRGVDATAKRDKWARHLRQAAKQAGLEVETTWDRNDKRLYFRGWKTGSAPARGRRTTASREADK